jgi:hypothetical protein
MAILAVPAKDRTGRQNKELAAYHGKVVKNYWQNAAPDWMGGLSFHTQMLQGHEGISGRKISVSRDRGMRAYLAGVIWRTYLVSATGDCGWTTARCSGPGRWRK